MSHTLPMNSKPGNIINQDPRTVSIVCGAFLFVFLVRLYVFLHTYMINPDGILYIHQARAVYYHNWSQIFNCGLSYLSVYPFLIDFIYFITSDWLLAARLVSFICGMGILIVLFFLFGRFFKLRTALLGMVVFALIPNHATVCADAMREPVAWFFACCGFLFFLRQDERGSEFWLFFAGVAFLLSAWARIEFSLLFLVSGVVLLFRKHPRRFIHFGAFLLPAGLVAAGAGIMIRHPDFSMSGVLRLTDLAARIQNPFTGYLTLQSQLKTLESTTSYAPIHFFFPEAGNMAWLVALGALINRMLESFYYPFFLLFIIGFGGLRQKFRNGYHNVYFLMLVGLSFVLLYFNTLNTWMLDNRFTGIVVFSAFIFLGYGIDSLFDIMGRRFQLTERTVLIGLCAVLLIFGLSKDLQDQEKDKLVYRKIAETIADNENSNQTIAIAGLNTASLGFVRFFTNYRVPDSPCPKSADDGISTTFRKIKKEMIDRNIKYFYWEEKAWRDHPLPFSSSEWQACFKPIGEWYHPDTGRLVVFERLSGVGS